MNPGKWKKGLIILVYCVWNISAFTQITPGRFQQFILEKKHTGNNNFKFIEEVFSFYTLTNFSTAWIQLENNLNRNIFLNELKGAASLGLQEKDYHYSFLEAFRNGSVMLHNTNDSIEAEVYFTDAAIHFYQDIAYGNTKPVLGFNGLRYNPGCHNIPELLATYLAKSELFLLIKTITPVLPEMPAIENKIKWFQSIMASPGFREATILSNKVNSTNQALVSKLHQLGIIDSVSKYLPDSTLKQKVKEAQYQFNLMADGVLRSTILKELNTPLWVRLEQLYLSINYYRWLFCLAQNQQVIVVNIPGACLKVYYNREAVFEMRMILGKKSTPTPTLASTVNEVILYPYWHVPYSIATKELLPAIKRDPGFLDDGNYQVLNKSGQIVDPYSINWHALSRGNFPYLIRQSTGCDNALGLIKLNFYSPFGVYLHDTPTKSLFKMNRRFYSHGCMRMEKPMDLGHLVLRNNQVAIDTLEQKGCLQNMAPIIVPADEHLPVIVWYNPAGVDSTGRILFFEDVYQKFTWTKKSS